MSILWPKSADEEQCLHMRNYIEEGIMVILSRKPSNIEPLCFVGVWDEQQEPDYAAFGFQLIPVGIASLDSLTPNDFKKIFFSMGTGVYSSINNAMAIGCMHEYFNVPIEEEGMISSSRLNLEEPTEPTEEGIVVSVISINKEKTVSSFIPMERMEGSLYQAGEITHTDTYVSHFLEYILTGYESAAIKDRVAPSN